MNVLIITNLFPNAQEPGRGIFNKQQFDHIHKWGEIRVIAPLPWFPRWVKNDRRSLIAEVKEEETIDGIRVYHPRYLILPKIGRSLYGWSLFAAIRPLVAEMQKTFDFDVILATWAYPDAFAAELVARKFERPLVIRVHGTDVYVASEHFWRRRMMRESFQGAYRVIAVSEKLKSKIVQIGIGEKKIEVIPNGVNKELFRPMDKVSCRRKLSLDESQRHIVYIGNLVPVKGVNFLIQASESLPGDVCCHIIGDGEFRSAWEEEAGRKNLNGRVKFYGRIKHADVPLWLNAADVFCLPSLSEGCPNVLLEALACGVPVVATRVGGIPELTEGRPDVLLVRPENALALADALREGLELEKNRCQPSVPVMSWEENAQRVWRILEEAVQAGVQKR